MALAVPLYQRPSFSVIYGGRTNTPPELRSRSQCWPVPRYAFSASGRYCVKTPTVSMSELTQLDSGKSMMRYFPPNGTAGFAMWDVRMPKRLPWPPASSMATIFFFIAVSFVCYEFGVNFK